MTERRNQSRMLVFENCGALTDKISFGAYKNQTQPNHEDIKRRCKAALLRQPNRTSNADSRIFEQEFKKQVGILQRHYDSLKNGLTPGYSISSKLSVKLGFEYFYSKLFKWQAEDLTINELSGLLNGEIPNTNMEYYNPLNNGRPLRPNYEILRCSFTDHSSVKGDLNGFYKSLAEMAYVADTDEAAIVNYRVIYKNTHKLVDQIYLNSDESIRNDEFIRDLFEKTDSFELKFDRDFNLMSINLNRVDQDTTQSTLDLLRGNKFDIRFQIKQSTCIDLAEVNEVKMLLQTLFGNLIKLNSNEDAAAEKLVLNCDSEQITFLRREVVKKYSQKEDTQIDFELNVINYNEYRVHSKLADGKVIYEYISHVENYVTMTSSLNQLFDQLGPNGDLPEGLTTRIWMLGIWLSNCASNCA